MQADSSKLEELQETLLSIVNQIVVRAKEQIEDQFHTTIDHLHQEIRELKNQLGEVKVQLLSKNLRKYEKIQPETEKNCEKIEDIKIQVSKEKRESEPEKPIQKLINEMKNQSESIMILEQPEIWQHVAKIEKPAKQEQEIALYSLIAIKITVIRLYLFINLCIAMQQLSQAIFKKVKFVNKKEKDEQLTFEFFQLRQTLKQIKRMFFYGQIVRYQLQIDDYRVYVKCPKSYASARQWIQSMNLQFINLQRITINDSVNIMEDIEYLVKGNFPVLSELYIGGNNIGDIGMKELVKKKFPYLRKLFSSHNNLSQQGFRYLIQSKDNFPSLSLLNLSQNLRPKNSDERIKCVEFLLGFPLLQGSSLWL